MGFKVNNCCCFSLRTGGLVIGWINVVGIILAIVLRLITYALLQDQVENHPDETNLTQQDLDAFGIQTLMSVILSSIPALIVNGLLIYGIQKNKHNMLLPWLVLGALGAGIGAIALAISIITLLVIKPLAALLVMVIVVPIFAFGVWIWLVVCSLYQEIKETNQRATRMPLQSSYIENGQMDRAPAYTEINKSPIY